MQEKPVARWRKDLGAAFNLLLFGAAIFVLDDVLRHYPYRDIVAAVYAIPIYGIVVAVLVTALGYLALVGYDYIAFRFIGRPLPLRRVLIPSFITFAVSNNAPASVVTAGGVRYKLYRPLGITPADAAVIAGFNVITYTLGLCALAGLALVLGRETGIQPGFAVPGRVLGGILLVAVATYMLLAHLGPRRIHWRRIDFDLPSGRQAWEQLGISVADWLLSSSALYVLLHTVTPIPFIPFLATFLVAAFVSLLLPIPGGIGVFEAVVLLLRPTGVPAPNVLAALLLYRMIYYLLPLLVAGVLLELNWLREARRSGQPYKRLVEELSKLAPRLVAWTTFLAGMVLMLTGAISTNDRRLAWLGDVLPIGIIEASHFLGSVVGAVLVVLAWGLERRARLAYELVRVLFGVGIVLAILRSLDVRLAIFLALGWGIVIMSGRFFPRAVAPLPESMGRGWKFAITAVLVIEAWAAVLLYRHTELSGEVWWHFALFGQAPRALRATIGGAVVILLFVLSRLLYRQARHGRGGHH